MEYLGVKLEMGTHKVVPLEQGMDRNQFDYMVGFERVDGGGGNKSYNYYIMDLNLNLINLEKDGWKMESTIKSTSAFSPTIKPLFEDRDGVIEGVVINIFEHPKIIGQVIDIFFKRTSYFNWGHFNLLKENRELNSKIEKLESELNDLKK